MKDKIFIFLKKIRLSLLLIGIVIDNLIRYYYNT